jgi:predicted Rossmann fold flavoprotein
MKSYDVIVLGAGAAGLMCAMQAGAKGRRVLLLDHADEAGAKILISGGGRCNFTNLDCAPDRFLSANPHFVKSALSRYTQRDFVGLVERHRIAYHERTLGQLFCIGSAREIVAMFLAECAAARVDIRTGTKITDVAHGGEFRVATDRGMFDARSLVLATGGKSIPKIGATGFAYDVARRFGLAVVEPRPGLVPLTFEGASLDFCRGLSGISTDSVVSFGKRRFREALLFTHRGLSGPAILQISSYWKPGEPLVIDMLPDVDLAAVLLDRKRSRPKAEAHTILAEFLPARLSQAIAREAGIEGVMGGQSDKTLAALAQRVKAWRVLPSGTEGFAKAEVTVGGIDTACLSSQTMEARTMPGLHAIGEAVDVTGWLGGYNFQWAWSSGWVAGQAIGAAQA